LLDTYTTVTRSWRKQQSLLPTTGAKKNNRRGLVFETAVKTGEASQFEDRIVALLVQLVAPVPGAGQPTVNARPCVVKVVGAGPVEGVLVKVLQDVQLTVFDRPVAFLNHLRHAAVFS